MSDPTHEAIVIGGVRTAEPCKIQVKETDEYWVTEEGKRYRKTDGYSPDGHFVNRIDLASIKPITGDNVA